MSIIPFEGMIDSVLGIVNKFIPDTAQKDQAKAEITTLMLTTAAQQDAAQADINKTEASSGSLFVSGWRPFIGWVCGLSFAGHYVLVPSFAFIHSCYFGACTPQPYDMAEIDNVLYLLLGFGAMRTVDKSVGVVMGALGK